MVNLESLKLNLRSWGYSSKIITNYSLIYLADILENKKLLKVL
jgi:hypothetical protein